LNTSGRFGAAIGGRKVKAKHSSAKPHPSKESRGKSTAGTPKLHGGAKPGVHGGTGFHAKVGMKGGHKTKTSH
jgi:hypothetical protein